MVKIETMGCKQPTVLWVFSDYDGNGEPVVAAPIEILTRWESQMKEFLSSDNTPIGTTVTAMVDRDIPINSRLWLGSLTDLPASPTGVLEVTGKDTVPDVKNRNSQYDVFLRKIK